MNFKKIFASILMLPLLVACDTSSIAGSYVFQMGKEAGTHFNVTLNLKNDEYKTETFTEEGFKKFDFSINVKIGNNDIEDGSLAHILSFFADEKGTTTIPGYYKVSNEKDAKGETILKVGIEYSYIIDKASQIYEDQTGEQLSDDISDGVNQLNNSEIIQSLLYSTYKDNIVNFYIPVSVADAVLQLYWYGVDIQVYYTDPDDITTLEFAVVDVEPHDYGSIPNQEDVNEINKTFPSKHNALSGFIDLKDNKFRPFHQVKLGLSKR